MDKSRKLLGENWVTLEHSSQFFWTLFCWWNMMFFKKQSCCSIKVAWGPILSLKWCLYYNYSLLKIQGRFLVNLAAFLYSRVPEPLKSCGKVKPPASVHGRVFQAKHHHNWGGEWTDVCATVGAQFDPFCAEPWHCMLGSLRKGLKRKGQDELGWSNEMPECYQKYRVYHSSREGPGPPNSSPLPGGKVIAPDIGDDIFTPPGPGSSWSLATFKVLFPSTNQDHQQKVSGTFQMEGRPSLTFSINGTSHQRFPNFLHALKLQVMMCLSMA